MKTLTILALLALVSHVFAHNNEKTKKSVGHDKEHEHVPKDTMDHEHNDDHHGPHDHKAHHPDHDAKQPKKR